MSVIRLIWTLLGFCALSMVTLCLAAGESVMGKGRGVNHLLRKQFTPLTITLVQRSNKQH